MKNLPALSVPIAVAMALVSGAATAQDRPNTTLVQKSKASPVSSSKAKTASQTPARLSGTSDRDTAKRDSPNGAGAAPPSEAMQHGCQGKDIDA
jgi:hypothetical protein